MLTSYPDLFGAVSCGVPLLDMAPLHQALRRLLLDCRVRGPGGSGPVGVHPHLLALPPAQGRAPSIPDTLIWTATSDDRVGPVQARKMAARMLELGVQNVWFHEALEGGHAGASDNRQAARLQALSHTFLWRALAKLRPSRPVLLLTPFCTAGSGYSCVASNSIWRRARAAEWTSLLMKGRGSTPPGVQIPPSPRQLPRETGGVFAC